MPNTPSAKKRLRQSLDRRARNRSIKSVVRTSLRKVRDAIQSGDAAKADEAFRVAVKQLDKAAAARILHANKAARTKSRLSKAVKGVKASA
ncbi:MAG: 30S ribosomal protein S20 [Planctomycetales bacterium]|nr:30S ribosomal protein S20 [Planctomycetales bacterium]